MSCGVSSLCPIMLKRKNILLLHCMYVATLRYTFIWTNPLPTRKWFYIYSFIAMVSINLVYVYPLKFVADQLVIRGNYIGNSKKYKKIKMKEKILTFYWQKEKFMKWSRLFHKMKEKSLNLVISLLFAEICGCLNDILQFLMCPYFSLMFFSC